MIDSRFEKNRVLSFDERVDPASTALVVIDVQNDFALPQGVCGAIGDDVGPAAPMVKTLRKLLDSARKSRVLIIFVRAIYDDVMLSPALAEQHMRRGYGKGICLSGTAGVEFYGGIGPQDAPNEICITKHRYSAFWGTSLDLILRQNGIRTVVLAGIATEVCVESTARDAFFKDYRVVVPEDCVASYSDERQKAALTVIARSFGIVGSASDIISVWHRFENGKRNWEPEVRAQRVLTTLERRLDPVHTALVLINLQGEFYRAGAADNSNLRATLAPIRGLLTSARQAGCLIVHVRSAGALEFDHASDFNPMGEEQTLLASRTSAFTDTAFDMLLHSNCIRSVVLAGATTNGSIESTVREAADHDYHVVVAADGVSTFDRENQLHEASLANISRYFGTVTAGREIESIWERSARRAENSELA
jgi:ureidoacrylate peracid hydrolase